jgi:hypothetical protein
MKQLIVGLMFLGSLTSVLRPLNAGIVSNGGFEEGDFGGGDVFPIPDWVGTEFPLTFATQDPTFLPFGPHSGLAAVAFSSVGDLDPISQLLPTVPGQKYLLSFWLASDGQAPNAFWAFWNEDELLFQTDIPTHDYKEYIFSVVSTQHDIVTFFGRDDLGYLSLDDVSLIPVPEPAALEIMGSLLVTALGLGRLRRSS